MRILISVLAFATIAQAPIASATDDELPANITRLSDGLYRAQNNRHFTLFMVTSDGIILADPINEEFSTWLKDEMTARFAVPVKYVLYSHHHWDHASGGEVFADTATFVGHKNMALHLGMPTAGSLLPADVSRLDLNGNGTLELDETEGRLERLFSLYDANEDGRLNGAEIARGPIRLVHPPDILFDTELKLSLGGRSVDMTWAGPITHSNDMSIIRFLSDNGNVLFVVDFIQIKQLPYGKLGVHPGLFPDWLESIRAVEKMDYEVVAPGHNTIGTRADIIAFRNYLEDLRNAVSTEIRSGKSLADIQKSVSMIEYKEWSMYEEWKPDNIKGMYEILMDSH